MGGGGWTDAAWTSYSSTHVTGKSTSAVFTSRSIDKDLDPKGVTIRESRDSVDNPESSALGVFVDVTGSMGMLADAMVRKGCNVLATEIYDRKPITNPHIMFGAIGDVYCDSAPLQVTQFEADIRIAEQLTKIYLEGGGGGNSCESYSFPWYFMGMHTSIDCFEKRGKKGYLFTAGDEEPEMTLKAVDIERFLGYKPEKDYTAQELLTLVSRQYHVFHLIVEEGSHMRSYKDRTVSKWRELLGQRAILLSDHTKMAEVIVSTIQVIEGESTSDIVASWDGSTGLVVSKAIDGLVPGSRGAGKVVTF